MTSKEPTSRMTTTKTSLIRLTILLCVVAVTLYIYREKAFRFSLQTDEKLTKHGRPLERGQLGSSLSATYDRACRKLFADPQPQIRCARDHETGWLEPECANGSMSFQSQFSQDYYLYTHHFRHLRRAGVYLDVAANEPVRISNTWVFDACLGWRGVCVEAHPLYVARLRQARTCFLIPTCVGDSDAQEVSFILSKGMSGIEDTNKNLHRVNKSDQISLRCTTLRTEFQDMAIGRIDYFSLDVEGHEMHVLRGIDWNQLSFNVITVEVSGDSINEVEGFLTGKGYVRHVPTLSSRTISKGLLHMDAVFLHPDVKFGSPE